LPIFVSAVLVGSRPSCTILASGILTGALPAGAILTGALPTGGILTGALPTGGILTGALPASGILTGALPASGILTGALPTGGILTGALPTGGILTGALLTGSSLVGALLTGAAFRRLRLTGAMSQTAGGASAAAVHFVDAGSQAADLWPFGAALYAGALRPRVVCAAFRNMRTSHAAAANAAVGDVAGCSVGRARTSVGIPAWPRWSKSRRRPCLATGTGTCRVLAVLWTVFPAHRWRRFHSRDTSQV
jgi:hypothetical protein